MVQDSLGRNLRVLRAERGITLGEAEELTGVTQETISALEHSQRGAYTSTLRKLADAYGVTLGDLMGEASPVAVGKAEAPKAGRSAAAESAKRAGEVLKTPKKGQRSLGSEATLMSRPEVWEWLLKQGHVPPEEFPSLALDLSNEEEIDEAIDELHETKARILEGLRDPSVQKTLFGSVRPGDFEGRKARMGEVFRPGKLAWTLGWEIRSEYLAKETALVNYGRELFVEGKADDYLVRGPVGEHDHVRHELMLEERRRVLEEKYAAQLAAV